MKTKLLLALTLLLAGCSAYADGYSPMQEIIVTNTSTASAVRIGTNLTLRTFTTITATNSGSGVTYVTNTVQSTNSINGQFRRATFVGQASNGTTITNNAGTVWIGRNSTNRMQLTAIAPGASVVLECPPNTWDNLTNYFLSVTNANDGVTIQYYLDR
jgi:hypothetical protein